MRFLCFSLFTSLCWGNVALAGDYYFNCATPSGTYSLQDGGNKLSLFDGRKKLEYQSLRKTTIRQQKGFCTAKGGQKFAWNSHQYLVELTTNVNGSRVDLMFLCEQGSSGVPASISDCQMSTTSHKLLKPAYTRQLPAKIKHATNKTKGSKRQASTGWSSLTDGPTASTIYAWSSGCKKDCNDEVDYQPIISIDCSRKNKTAQIIFWELGREKELERKVGVWVTIDSHTTRLKAKGSPKLTGVSLDTTLPVTHPLFEEIAAGKHLKYGSSSGTKGKAVTLNGSGKAVRRMLKACR